MPRRRRVRRKKRSGDHSAATLVSRHAGERHHDHTPPETTVDTAHTHPPRTPHQLLAMQQRVGNRAVQRMLTSPSGMVQRAGGDQPALPAPPTTEEAPYDSDEEGTSDGSVVVPGGRGGGGDRALETRDRPGALTISSDAPVRDEIVTGDIDGIIAALEAMEQDPARPSVSALLAKLEQYRSFANKENTDDIQDAHAQGYASDAHDQALDVANTLAEDNPDRRYLMRLHGLMKRREAGHSSNTGLTGYGSRWAVEAALDSLKERGFGMEGVTVRDVVRKMGEVRAMASGDGTLTSLGIPNSTLRAGGYTLELQGITIKDVQYESSWRTAWLKPTKLEFGQMHAEVVRIVAGPDVDDETRAASMSVNVKNLDVTTLAQLPATLINKITGRELLGGGTEGGGLSAGEVSVRVHGGGGVLKLPGGRKFTGDAGFKVTDVSTGGPLGIKAGGIDVDASGKFAGALTLGKFESHVDGSGNGTASFSIPMGDDMVDMLSGIVPPNMRAGLARMGASHNITFSLQIRGFLPKLQFLNFNMPDLLPKQVKAVVKRAFVTALHGGRAAKDNIAAVAGDAFERYKALQHEMSATTKAIEALPKALRNDPAIAPLINQTQRTVNDTLAQVERLPGGKESIKLLHNGAKKSRRLVGKLMKITKSGARHVKEGAAEVVHEAAEVAGAGVAAGTDELAALHERLQHIEARTAEIVGEATGTVIDHAKAAAQERLNTALEEMLTTMRTRLETAGQRMLESGVTMSVDE